MEQRLLEAGKKQLSGNTVREATSTFGAALAESISERNAKSAVVKLQGNAVRGFGRNAYDRFGDSEVVRVKVDDGGDAKLSSFALGRRGVLRKPCE